MKLTKNTVTIRLLLFIGVFILLNMLAYEVYFRLDFTADKRYTLSNTTEDILKSLTDVVTVTAYFSEDVPPQLQSIRNDFQDLLAEYQNTSDDKVVYEFVNPNVDEQSEQQAQQQGIIPQQIAVRERDKVSQQRAYLGAIIKIGAQQEVIPFIQPGSAMEYALSRAIKKMSTTNKPKVGFVVGHGEPAMQSFIQAQQELSTLYEVDSVSLDEANAWTDFKTLVIMAPTDSFPQAHLAQLDQFLASGGGLFVGINAVAGDLNQQMWSSLSTGLDEWLGAKGIAVESAFLTDAQATQITVQQRQGFFTMNRQIPFHYFPIITNYGDHPITKGLEAVLMQFVSPVSITNTDSTVSGGVIAYTSKLTGKILPPTRFDIEKQWSERDFTYGPQGVAAYLQGKIEGEVESRLVVVGDGDFATGQPGQGVNPNNINLFVNAIDWLTDDTGLIELRTKGVDNRLIEKQLSDGEKTTVKYTVFLLPIMIVLIFGFMRMQARRLRRVKWMEQDFG